RAYQPTAGGPEIMTALQTFLLGNTIPSSISGFKLIPILPSLVTLFIILLIAAALFTLWSRYSLSTAVLLTSASLLPPILLALLALITGKGYFHPRYVAASAIPLLILIASLASQYRQRSIKYAAYGSLTALATLALI